MEIKKESYASGRLCGVPSLKIYIILLVGLAVLLRLVFAWISLKNLPISTDEASIVLHAKDIVRGNFPLLFMGQPLLFPVEAYLMAPFVEWMPRDAFGARYQTLILGALSLVGFLLITRIAFPKKDRWPVILLILFPSVYLFLLTSAYSPPQYPTSLTLAWVSIYCVLRSRATAHKGLLVVAGLASGLALSNHLLAIPVNIGVLALIVFDGNARRGFQGALFFAAGLVVGVVPYLLAICCIPGAYKDLPTLLPLADIFLDLKNFVFTESLAGAMGIFPTIFPDFQNAHLAWPYGLRLVFTFGYIFFVGTLTVNRIWIVGKSVINRCWPTLLLVDSTLIISLLTLASFAGHDPEPFAFRYLLHTVWCLPFLLGHAYLICRGRWKILIGRVVIILAVFNIIATMVTIKEWRKPRRIRAYSDIPPIESLLKELASRKITHCYASFWLAYRITFESDEKILCTMPYNERFPFWPYPYKEEIDHAENAVYILTQTFASKLPAQVFEQNLNTQGIRFSKFKVSYEYGFFLVYHDFTYPRLNQEHLLGRNDYVLRREEDSESINTSSEHAKNTANLHPTEQKFQPWLEVDFITPQILTHMNLVNLPFLANIEENLRISVYANNQWRTLSATGDYSFDLLSFSNNHPIYNEIPRNIRFNPIGVRSIKIEVSNRVDKKTRSFNKFEIYAEKQHP